MTVIVLKKASDHLYQTVTGHLFYLRDEILILKIDQFDFKNQC